MALTKAFSDINWCIECVIIKYLLKILWCYNPKVELEMYLDKNEERMLAGEYGSEVGKAMEFLVKIGDAFDYVKVNGDKGIVEIISK